MQQQNKANKAADSPLLLCDIDGVVYPYMGAIRTVVESIVGHTLPTPRWYNLERAWGITQAVHQAAHLRLFATSKSHEMPPIEGAPEALWAIHERGVEIVFLTRRVDYTASIGGSFDRAANVTSKWLESWAPPHDLCFEMNKTDFEGRSTLMLEDNPAEAEAMVAQGRHVWLIKQLYNEKSDIRRCQWGDIEIMDELTKSGTFAGTSA